MPSERGPGDPDRHSAAGTATTPQRIAPGRARRRLPSRQAHGNHDQDHQYRHFVGGQRQRQQRAASLSAAQTDPHHPESEQFSQSCIQSAFDLSELESNCGVEDVGLSDGIVSPLWTEPLQNGPLWERIQVKVTDFTRPTGG